MTEQKPLITPELLNDVQDENINFRKYVQYFILQNTALNKNNYTIFKKNVEKNSKEKIKKGELAQIAYNFDVLENETEFNNLINTITEWNEKFSVSVTFNSADDTRYLKKNMCTRNHLFIDIDEDPTLEEMNEVLVKIYEFGFQPSYIAKTPHGLHILIPVRLEINNSNEKIVKQFNDELREINEKVDDKVTNSNRLIRFPQSWHRKNDQPNRLVTLYFNENIDEAQLKANGDALNQFQPNKESIKYDENNLINKNYKHIQSSFFNELINSEGETRLKYFEKLDNCEGKINTLIKNMAIYATIYTDVKQSIINFWQQFDDNSDERKNYVGKLLGWFKTISERACDPTCDVNNKLDRISYHELKAWLENNNWSAMLKFIEQDIVGFQKENGHPLKYFFDHFHIYKFNNYIRNDCYLAIKNNGNTKTLNRGQLPEQIYLFGRILGYDIFDVFGLKDNPKIENLSIPDQFDILYKHINSYLLKYDLVQVAHDKNYQPTYDRENHDMYYEGKKYLNDFTAPELFYYHDKSVTNQDGFPLIRELLFAQCGKDPKGYEWFMKRLAIIFQQPTRKCSTISVFIGDQGTGKTTMFEQIFRPILGHNTSTMDQSCLEGNFNGFVAGKLILFANEVGQNESNGKLANKVKGLATDATIRVEEKYKTSVDVNNYSNWIFTTNDRDPIKLEANDRRYTIYESKFIDETMKGDYFSRVWYPKWQKSKDSELKNFISFLKNVPVTFEEVNVPHYTADKKRLLERHLDNVESFVYYFQTGDESVIEFCQNNNLFSSRDIDDVFFSTANKYNQNLMTLKDLYTVYKCFCDVNGFNLSGRFNSFRDVLLSKIKIVEKNLKVGKSLLNAKSRRVICIDELKLPDSYKMGGDIK